MDEERRGPRGTEPAAVLRPWTMGDDDGRAVLRAFADPGMAAQAGSAIETLEDARGWIEPLISGTEGTETRLAAFAVDIGGTAVGNVMVSAIDDRHLTGWVSYWVTPSFRGRGLAAAGAAGLAGHCFDALGLYRLELGHRLNNPASGRVAAAAGFVREGTERQKLRYRNDDGTWERFDTALWARLATDPGPGIVPPPFYPA